jgi:hypothetical protein
MWVFYAPWAGSMFLLVAASDVPKSPSVFGDAFSTGPAVPDTDMSQWDRIRKYPYYGGVSLNLVAVAILVEMSAGLIRSPFTPVMYAIVLGGQQLGRYIDFDEDHGRWRFEIYVGRRLKVAPFLPGCSRDAGESEAIVAVERYVRDVVEPLEETSFSIEWKALRDNARLVAYLRQDR